jgi:hypothetical protein
MTGKGARLGPRISIGLARERGFVRECRSDSQKDILHACMHCISMGVAPKKGSVSGQVNVWLCNYVTVIVETSILSRQVNSDACAWAQHRDSSNKVMNDSVYDDNCSSSGGLSSGLAELSRIGYLVRTKTFPPPFLITLLSEVCGSCSQIVLSLKITAVLSIVSRWLAH